MKTIDYIIAYENGELDGNDLISLFSELIKTKQAWNLQGHYGRTARQLIKFKYITETGIILKTVTE